MADDVTLRTCPCCGGKAVRVAAPKPNDPRGWVYHALRCENYCLVTTWQCTPEKAAEIWNSRVSDPRIAELEGQVALLTAALANAEGQNPETWTAT